MLRRPSLAKLFTSSSSGSDVPKTLAGVNESSSGLADGADGDANGCAIRVVVRARPLNERELQTKSPVIVNVSRTSIQIINPIVFLDPSYLDAISTPSRRASANDLPITLSSQGVTAALSMGECRTFNFDRCFGVNSSTTTESEPFANSYDIDFQTQRPNQELIFDEVGRDMINSAFQGFNCTILAYGQTGSGKTHTMVGEKNSKGKGLIPRVCEALFQEIDTRRASENSTRGEESTDQSDGMEAKRTIYSATISYCEIYKEKVNDLLEAEPLPLSPRASAPKPRLSLTQTTLSASGDDAAAHPPLPNTTCRRTLRVREHPATGPFVEGLSTRSVTSYDEIAEEMLAGDKLRSVAATLMNPVSSRSHAVFTITFTQTSFDPATQSANDKTSKICMIDLAGSERADASGTSGDRLKEGAMINKSLTTLGRVISALSKQTTERVPYRDSTLTWLLKESLGGNAKTTMIAMVSPSSDNYEETMSTLRYAESAKKVINRAVVNEDKNARIIRQLREEIADLRSQLSSAKRSPTRKASNAGLSASLNEREEFYQQLQKEVEFFRSQQQQQLLVVADESPQGTDSRTLRLHRTLPSLVNIQLGSDIHDHVLAYTLSEGATVFGTEPATDSTDQVATTSGASKEHPDAAQPSQSRRSSWSPRLLKRRSSSRSSASEDTAAGASNTVGDDSATNGRGLLRDASAVTCRLIARDDDITPRHASILCTATVKEEQSSTEESQETANVSPEYQVTIQALDDNGAVKVNGTRVPVGDQVKLTHGDLVEFGSSYRLRFHVPGSNVLPQASEDQSNLNSAGTNDASAPISGSADETVGSEDILRHAVDEANAICKRLRVETEFEVYRGSGKPNEPSSSTQGQGVVAVKKRLAEYRYSVENWDLGEFEKQLSLLRDVSESLDRPNIPTATMNGTESSDRSGALDSASTTKLSTSRPPAITPISTRHDHSQTAKSSSDRTRLQARDNTDALPLCVRLLGYGQIHLDSFRPSTAVGGGSSFSVTIYNLSGDTIGALETRIDASGTLSNVTNSPSLNSSKGDDRAKLRIFLDKLELDVEKHLVSAGVSLTVNNNNAPTSVRGASKMNAGSCSSFSTPRLVGIGLTDEVDYDTSCSVDRRTFKVNQCVDTTMVPNAGGAVSTTTTVAMNADDRLTVEVWGYEQPMRTPTEVPTHRMEFYASVDVDERGSDGLYHPVAVKTDGTLRLTCNRPRRLNVRVTQSDLHGFALARIVRVSVSPPLHVRGDAVDAFELAGKSAQSFHSKLESDSSTAVPESPTPKSLAAHWCSLDFRGEPTVDATSRTIGATLRWDQVNGQSPESPDATGSRTVYRVVIAFTTQWSPVPVVVSKYVVTKLTVSSVMKQFTRGRESAQLPWWARERSGRHYRLGTWYTTDITEADSIERLMPPTAPTAADPSMALVEGPDDTNHPSSNGDASLKSDAGDGALVEAAIANHVRGTLRMDNGLELERQRQKVFLALLNNTRDKENGDDQEKTRVTADQVNVWLEQSQEDQDGDLEYECIQLESTQQLFLRHKQRKSVFVGLMGGRVVDLSALDAHSDDIRSGLVDSSSVSRSSRDLNVLHRVRDVSTYFASEPVRLETRDAVDTSDMCGYLMVSLSHSPDDAAAALATLGNGSNKQSRGSPLVWRRQWFVLKRPFLYSFDSFAQQSQTGVMDISKCQLIALPAPLPPTSPRDHETSSLPFAFRLVCLAGKKTVVWTLQASTSSEVRAWLASMQAVKVGADADPDPDIAPTASIDQAMTPIVGTVVFD